MVLSRIWSAFIIIAVLVATVRMIGGDEKIFTRMVVGKSSDKFDSIYYVAIDSAVSLGLSRNYSDFLREYGYARRDSAQKTSVLLTATLNHDSVRIVKAANPDIKVYTYLSIQNKLVRKVDGIIETAKNAVMDI